MLDEEAFEPTVTLSQNLDNVAITLIPEQQQTLEIVRHLALYSKMLIAVTGPHGSGKTTLAHELLYSSEHQEDILTLDATIMLGVPAILRRLGDTIQQPIPENRTMAIELLRVQAEQRAALGRSLIIIIDQAEQLDAETLNELAEVAQQIPEGFAIVLFGLTGYETHLAPAADQAPIHIQKIQPLSQPGAQQLLQQVYSPNQPLPLSEQEFFSVFQQSKGVVGELLALAGDLFLATTEDNSRPDVKASHKKASLKDHFPMTHVFALLFLLIALALSYFYNPSKELENAQLADTVAPEPVDVLRGLPLPQEQEAEVAAQNQAEDYNFANDQTAAVKPATIDTDDEPKVEPANKRQPQTKTQPNKKEPVAQQPAAETRPNPAQTNGLDKNKLLAINNGVIVQLFGSYQQKNAEKFKQNWQQQLDAPLYLYETKNQNKAWFVVVAGDYPDKKTASQAIKSWPNELQQASPWIRDIKTVQESLR